MESREIVTEVPFSLRAIRCENDNDCGMWFVLIAVIEMEDENGNKEHSIMPQAGSYFCPYCGTKQSNKELEKEKADAKGESEGS